MKARRIAENALGEQLRRQKEELRRRRGDGEKKEENTPTR